MPKIARGERSERHNDRYLGPSDRSDGSYLWYALAIEEGPIPAPRYSEAFKEAAVKLHGAARKSYKQLGAELGVSGYSIRKWVLESRGQALSPALGSEGVELQRLRRENRILREERDIARKAAALSRASNAPDWIFEFIQTERANHPITLLCRVMGYPKSSLYYREGVLRRPQRAASAEETRLLELITSIHRASDGTFGSPRITAALRDQGEVVNQKRVRRLMRIAGIAGVSRRLAKPPIGETGSDS
jgi:transposase-like protein